MMTTKSKLSREDVLELLRRHKEVLRERFGVTEISLFGSFARDEATEDSDVDVVVEFDETPSWHVFFGAQRYIENISGRSVDLVRSGNIRKELRPYVEIDLTKV
ncbi:MAG: nucleotidyltransferase family protein [Chloroflexi bacterium]|nr:nucleotidyltransferase family protein [Chloroflexota bacterium]MYK62523.1 nucleotidyltransferase family protein [Chloroflexota bacterium]